MYSCIWAIFFLSWHACYIVRGRDGQPGRQGLLASQETWQVLASLGKSVAGGPKQVRLWLVDWAVPHLCVDTQGGTKEEQDRPRKPGFQRG